MSIETAETGLDVAEPPPPWLVEFQRGRMNGASPLTTFQGMLCDEIVLPQSALDHADPEQVARAADAWAEALLNQAHFLPGEFAQEAMIGLHARDYVSQVMAGGHAQYWSNRKDDELALKCAGAGLKSMLADAHLECFNLLVRLKRAKPAMARKIAAEHEYRSVAAALKDLDRKLSEVERNEPLAPRQKVWLKSLRKLKIAPDAEMTGYLQRAAQSNPLFPRRRTEYEQLRAEELRASPAFQAVKALCDMADLQVTGLHKLGFAPMHSAWPDGPDVRAYVMRADTNQGPRAALFYTEGGMFKRYLSVLVAQGGGLPSGSLALTKGEYLSIVPVEA